MNKAASLITLPTRVFIAIEIVLDIAWHSGGKLVSSTDITNRAGIARRSLEPILQELTRAQILAGVRGPHGGYRLARERRNITIDMIMNALLDDQTADLNGANASKSDLTKTSTDLTPSSSPLTQKVILPMWEGLCLNLWQELAPITIEQLCTRAGKAKIPSQGRIMPDFEI